MSGPDLRQPDSPPIVQKFIPHCYSAKSKLNSSVKKEFIVLVLLLVGLPGAASSQTVDQLNKLRIAQALEQAGEFDKALDFYKQLYGADSSNFVYFDGLRRIYMNLKEYTPAEGLIRDRLVRDPGNATLYCELGDAFYKAGYPDSAGIVWNDAIELDPKNPGTYQAVGDIMTQNRLFEKAIDVFRRGEKVTSAKSGFIIQIARLYFYNMNYRESVRELLRLLQTDNKSSAMAYIQAQLGSYSSSEEAVNRFTEEMKKQVDDNSDNTYYRTILAFLYMEQKDYSAAYKVYKWLDQQSGANGIELLSFAERAYNDEAYGVAADAYMEVSQLSKARPVVAQSLMGYANSLCRIGENGYSRGDRPCATNDTLKDLNASLAAYGRIISGYTETQYFEPAVLNSIDIDMNYFHDFNGAEKLFKEHGEFSPEYFREAALSRIRLHMMEGRFSDALTESVKRLEDGNQDHDQAVSGNSFSDEVRYEAARSLYYLGNFDSALFYLEKIASNPMSDAANEAIQLLDIISNNKGAPDALKEYASAMAMEVSGRIPEAAGQLEEIVKTYPQVPLADHARFDLAAAYCRMGKVSDALKLYASLASDSTDIFADRAQFRAAKIYQVTLHDTSRAIQEYESFLVRFPNSIYQDKVRGILRELLGSNS